MDKIPLRSMAQRDYRMIPVDKIKVVISRSREKKQFYENVRSINEMGLYKPILVNKRNLAATGFYELICGEGRLIAAKRLGKTHIRAEIVTCTRKCKRRNKSAAGGGGKVQRPANKYPTHCGASTL